MRKIVFDSGMVIYSVSQPVDIYFYIFIRNYYFVLIYDTKFSTNLFIYRYIIANGNIINGKSY